MSKSNKTNCLSLLDSGLDDDAMYKALLDKFSEDDIDEDHSKELKPIKLLALDVDGVLTDGRIYIGNEGEVFKVFDANDGLGISIALRNGLEIALVTGRRSEIIHRRAEELGISIIMEGVSDKAVALQQLRRQLKLKKQQIAYIGDDLNDLPAFANCGFAFAPASAMPEIIEAADYELEDFGGSGAVREAIEMILKAQGKWQGIVAAYLGSGQGDKQ